MDRIPATGLRGVKLREAAATEFRAVIQLVERAVKDRIYPGQDRYVDIVALYPDRVVVARDGRTYAYPYSIGADNQVAMGDPVEVTQEFQPVTLREAVFIEAVGEAESGKWLIRVMRAGLSANGNFYPGAVLREAAPLFNNARVFIKSDAEHVKGGGKDVRNLVGGLSGAKFVEGGDPDLGEIQALLTLIEPAGEVATKLREASDRGLSGLFGFSIDADGTAKTQLREGRKVRVAQSITKVNSVDLIVEPAAGGELIRMVESVTSPTEEGDMLRDKLLQTIQSKAPTVYAKLDPATATDEQIEVAYREALNTREADGGASPGATQGGSQSALGAGANDIDERLRMIEARANARVAIADCNLPQPAKDRLRAEFERRERFVEADVSAAIEAERGYLAKFTESGQVNLGGYGAGARAEDRGVKVADMLDAFFQPGHKDHGKVHSFKEAYIEITGDRRVTGRIENCDRARLRESVGFREAIDTTQFNEIMGGALGRAMIADYRNPSVYDVWRPWLSVTTVPDFRTNERYRIGGYGDLAAVNQGADYAAMTSPADEKSTYAATKRGGLETVTLESIKNDDVGAIRVVPTKMSRAAKRTLAKFALDFIRTNPAIYDAVALFAAGHNNLGAAALDATTLAAGRLAMLKQAELTSTDRLGIGPKFLLVPPDLEQAATDLFNRNTNNDKTFVNSLSLTVLPIWYWTDANDWALSADPMDIPTVEIGFLDGQQEPELFVQDNPTVGSLFTADKITYKLRHIYGGAVMDFRGMYKAVVA